jgi:hypothetical protein
MSRFLVAIFWVALSGFWLSVWIEKIAKLRAAHEFISPFRYLEIVLWVMLLVFWAQNAWKNWRRYRAPEQLS